MTASSDADSFADLDRNALAILLREWLLHGHLQDRVGIPLLYQHGVDREGAEQIAIDEWAAASPLYSLRMQETMGFGGQSVVAIVKNLQIDIGAPPQYMDFQITVTDENHAVFELGHCGALMDVEPMGDEWVRGMCHTIEDPTFDATAAATSPYAVMRPIHRPPRTPTDRMPHCAWRIDIDPTTEPAVAHSNLAIVGASLAATLPATVITEETDPDGQVGYPGTFDPALRFEDLSRATLLAALTEVALQSHVLLRSYLLSVSERVSPEVAAELGPRVLTGVAPITAERLVRAYGITDTGAPAIARVLALHPSFQPPEYVTTHVEALDDSHVRVSVSPSPMFEESDDFVWLAGLKQDGDRAVAALARAINPLADAARVEVRNDELVAYEITVDPNAAPRLEEPETALARFSGAATFEFH
ncbi:MAG: hypothetical protein ABIP21_01015 [Acidimicrobiia bacterium]